MEIVRSKNKCLLSWNASMISDNTIMKSNSTNLYWIKTVEQDGTENLTSNSTIPHSYNRISHCPFCGNVIVENLQ